MIGPPVILISFPRIICRGDERTRFVKLVCVPETLLECPNRRIVMIDLVVPLRRQLRRRENVID